LTDEYGATTCDSLSHDVLGAGRRGTAADGVGDEELGALEVNAQERFIECLPGGTHEGSPNLSFVASRALTQQNANCVLRTLPQHWLNGISSQCQGTVPASSPQLSRVDTLFHFTTNL
jgi:hypothetical protein